MPLKARRIALVGYGGWGPNLARVLADLGQLSCIFEICPARRQSAQSAHPQVPCETAFSPSGAPCDAVVLATPAASHTALAQSALRAGLDVFVEKPLGLSPTAARATAALAQAAGRILMVGHLLLYHPAVRTMAADMQQNSLGPLRQLLAERHNFGIIRSGEDVLFSLGPHDVAVILHLTGMLPRYVTAQGQDIRSTGRLDACQMQLVFSPTLGARISLSWLHPLKTQRLVVQGSRAAFVFDDVARQLVLQPMQTVSGPDATCRAVRGAASRHPYPQDEPLVAEVRAFIEAIDTRQPPLSHAVHGVDVVRVLCAAQMSIEQNGRPVHLDEV